MRIAQGSRLQAQGLAFTVCCILFAVSYSYGETLTSTELIEKAKERDGKVVTYKGEAVTAILNRGAHSWVNLNDGSNAVGVWCESPKLKPIKFVGDYKHNGDIVEVEGTFNRACPLHGGEMDIHASEVRIITPGFLTRENLDTDKINIAIVLFLMTVALSIIFRKKI